MTESLGFNITSELERMKENLYIVLAKIKDKRPCITDDDFSDLRLIYTELLANAIIHGNKNNSHKRVRIFIEFTDKGIASRIMDEGNGFNVTEVLKPQEIIEDIFSDSGRGIKLVSSLTDELKFNRIGNEVRFLKKV